MPLVSAGLFHDISKCVELFLITSKFFTGPGTVHVTLPISHTLTLLWRHAKEWRRYDLPPSFVVKVTDWLGWPSYLAVSTRTWALTVVKGHKLKMWPPLTTNPPPPPGWPWPCPEACCCWSQHGPGSWKMIRCSRSVDRPTCVCQYSIYIWQKFVIIVNWTYSTCRFINTC